LCKGKLITWSLEKKQKKLKKRKKKLRRENWLDRAGC
jgi:hypothetical protein